MTTTYRLPIQIKHVLLKWPVEEYKEEVSREKKDKGRVHFLKRISP